ncbi:MULTISPECIES: putative holin-like toxin [unclassified Facklamia]|nr:MULTISPECIES: putative holin-like toxin [unclassified Facklamia]NEW64391.1 putative holin-like toxin [Facklamia sp. 252]NEW67772.1 putative holin-like toxin [Facklamia sp. 253]QQD64852.1 putative holin-like toxin [Aerococcaceae bacterium zg-252]
MIVSTEILKERSSSLATFETVQIILLFSSVVINLIALCYQIFTDKHKK